MNTKNKKKSYPMNLQKTLLFIALIALQGCSHHPLRPDNASLRLFVNNPDQITCGREYWIGTDDSAGVAKITMTPQLLIIDVSVKDDDIRIGNLQAHNNDSIELYFDIREKDERGSAHIGTSGVFQMVIVPAVKGKRTHIAWYQNKGQLQKPDLIKQVEATSKVLQGRWYQIKIIIPMDSLEEYHRKPTSIFNFAFGINDMDAQDPRTQLMSNSYEKNWETPERLLPVVCP